MSPGLMLLVRRLLSKSPDERYPSMAEVRADLTAASAAAAPVSGAEPAAAPEVRNPLIGRDAEYAELMRRLGEMLAGRGSVVMIGGEPGIGKTHLTEALLADAARRGAYAVVGHCYEMEGSPPDVPFIEMLEYAARVAARASFRKSLGEDAPEVAKIMPDLRNMFADIPPAMTLPPEQQRRFLFNGYRAFVERSARLTPIVAVIEDLHWADESSCFCFSTSRLRAPRFRF